MVEHLDPHLHKKTTHGKTFGRRVFEDKVLLRTCNGSGEKHMDVFPKTKYCCERAMAVLKTYGKTFGRRVFEDKVLLRVCNGSAIVAPRK